MDSNNEYTHRGSSEDICEIEIIYLSNGRKFYREILFQTKEQRLHNMRIRNRHYIDNIKEETLSSKMEELKKSIKLIFKPMKQKIECLLAWLEDREPKKWYNRKEEE